MNILAVTNDAYLVSMTAREWSHLAGLEIGHDFPSVNAIGSCCDVLNRIEKPVPQYEWRERMEPCLPPDEKKPEFCWICGRAFKQGEPVHRDPDAHIWFCEDCNKEEISDATYDQLVYEAKSAVAAAEATGEAQCTASSTQP